MPATYTARNRLVKQGTGDNAGSWGAELNVRDFDLIDDALDGVSTVPVAANVTLSSINGAIDQSRRRVLKFTGAGGFTVTIPGVSKHYLAHNTCAASVLVKTAAGASVTIASGQLTAFYCDGLNCYAATNLGSSIFTSTVTGPVAATSRASFNAPPGSAPVAPVDGDIWTTLTGGLRYRIDGLTLGPASELLVAGSTPTAGAATINFTLLGNFRAYDILLTDFRAAQTGRLITIRVSINGGVSYRAGATDYKYLYDSISSAGVRSSGGGAGNGIVLAGDILINAGGGNAMLNMRIEHPHNTTEYKMIRYDAVYEHNSDGEIYHLRGGGRYQGSLNEITHVRVFADLGNVHGSFALYGVR